MTLQEIKNKVAKDNDYPDFTYVRNNLSVAQIVAIMDEVAKEYAKEICNEFARGIIKDFNSN